MTEFNATSNQVPSPLPDAAQRKTPSRRRKAALAGFLSLFFSGAGQLYNRQPWKALFFALPDPLFLLAMREALLRSFGGLVVFFIVTLGWKFFVVAEAAYTASRAAVPARMLSHPRLTYILAATVVLSIPTFRLFFSIDQIKRWAGIGAFRVPSSSMCPTICEGERIFADMKAYDSKPPERGDLVLIWRGTVQQIFIKRVIGIAGDVVAPGPNGTILLNGNPLTFPPVCGSPVPQQKNAADYPEWGATVVPDGTYFVIGDNLGASYDSRIPQFGPVTPADVRGKPLYLYWSPDHSRIGCPTR
jgi:signal peptidase I